MTDLSSPDPKPTPQPEEPSEPREYLLIAGPCSAESRNQLMEVAERLQSLSIDLFRASIWKPRTRPGSFEGIGEEGLEWLREVKQRFGYRTTTEVCTAQQTEAALKGGVDVLWIGARTTTNPYSVKEIVETLRGTETPLLIKNPMCPDLSLWLGAIERCQAVGLNDITAVFRGFPPHSSFKLNYRNAPYWSIALELKERLPELPILCDPSHITGRSNAVGEVSQRALLLGFDGLMIECHPNPSEACTDASQQLTPEELIALVHSLKTYPPHANSENPSIDAYRILLAELDNLIVSHIANRMDLAQRIGRYKQSHHIPVVQEKQYQTALAHATAWGESLGLSPKFIQRFMDLLHEESIRIQQNA